MKKELKCTLLFFTFLSIYYNSFSQSSVSEAQSIFIYNFTRLIEWPSEYKSGDFIIGVYGSSDVFSDIKNYTSGKTVGNQPIVVKSITNLDDVSKCHIIFISYNKTKDIPLVIEKAGNVKTLIISEKKGALDAGASINFLIIDDKLKYEIKSANISKIGLHFNSILEKMSVSKS